jgi:hypothetical protein
MNEHIFIMCLMGLTLAGHLGLMFCRGWLIGECRREQNKMKTMWEDFKADQEKWRKDFEASHKSPWHIGEPKKRTA